MFIRRNGEVYDTNPSEDVMEFPEEMENAEIYRRHIVEVWSNTPGKDGSEYLGQEIFDEYPTDEQLYWCFAKYGDCVLRIKEECYLGVPKYSVFDPDKIKTNA